MKRRTWLLAVGALVLVGAATAPFGVVKDGATQAAAQKLATQEDLPAIAQADRVVIQIERPAKGSVEIKDVDLMKAIRGELKVTDGPPSGGMTQYTLVFYKGQEKIRSVWVYDYGEWGVERPKTSWTCGTSDKLVPAIEAALAASKK